MSLLRLTIFVFVIGSYSNSYAQQSTILKTGTDSPATQIAKSATFVQNIIASPIAQLNKAHASVTKYDHTADSLVTTIQDIPTKYYKQVDKKIDTYTGRITKKTERTLTKLSRWENKIHKLLQKASLETDNRLFGPGKMTFTIMLEKLKEGQSIVEKKQVQYHQYNDKLTTSIKYIESKKSQLDSEYVKSLNNTSQKVKQLNEDVANTDAAETFVKERKKQLLSESVKYIGKSKYLSKINKESYYYSETLKNYKEIFSDPDKAENTAKTILGKIPAFKKFAQQNSALATLFGGSSDNASGASLAGLQTRESVNGLIQGQIAAGGPGAKEIVSQNIQQGQAELLKLKDKLSKAGVTNSNQEIPDFKPNKQKSKTFFQRMEFEFNYQFGKSNKLMPNAMDIALGAGYKLNDKSIAGIGISYKLGIGTIDKIKITNQGIGLRSYLDWKLKKQFFISGGFEINHNSDFQNIQELKGYNAWQKAGLFGISKKLAIKTKFTKGTKLSLLYDVLHRQHVPVSQAIIFRVGYNF